MLRPAWLHAWSWEASQCFIFCFFLLGLPVSEVVGEGSWGLPGLYKQTFPLSLVRPHFQVRQTRLVVSNGQQCSLQRKSFPPPPPPGPIKDSCKRRLTTAASEDQRLPAYSLMSPRACNSPWHITGAPQASKSVGRDAAQHQHFTEPGATDPD